MTEHFTFEKALRNSSQIDFYKRLADTLAIDMDGFGYQFFTRSAFTRDQYGSIGRSNTCYRIQYLHQLTAFAYDMAPVECSALLLRSVFGSGSQFECRLDALQQSSVIPGFRDKVECTGLHPLYSQLYTAPGSHQNDRDIGTKNLYLF